MLWICIRIDCKTFYRCTLTLVKLTAIESIQGILMQIDVATVEIRVYKMARVKLTVIAEIQIP